MLPISLPTASLSLQTYVGVLRRKRRLILVVAFVTMLFALLPSLLAEPKYSSTASVRIAGLDQDSVIEDEDSDTAVDRAIELVTEMEILIQSPMRAKVLAELPADTAAFEEPEVKQVGYSQVVEITILAGDPNTATDVANTYARVFVEDRRNRATETLERQADELRANSATASQELNTNAVRLQTPGLPANEVASLQLRQSALAAQVTELNARADALSINAALRGSGTELIAPAELELEPISSSRLGAAVLGFTLGGLLGIAVAFVSDTLQDRLGSRDELAKVRPDVPVLAAVPHAEFSAKSPSGSFAAQEAYRYLRTGIRVFGLNADLRSVVITSAIGAEGKTTTAANLALAMADAGDRVVLVDCDLRRPGIHLHFALPNDRGLSSLVVENQCLDDVAHFVQANLAVVTAGPTVQNPTEVLGSEQFALVLQAIVNQSDFVILDTPPVLPVADALIAGQRVDGAIAVSRIGAVRRRSVRELLQRLEEAGIAIVGLVANDTEEPTEYGYYDSEPALDLKEASVSS